MAKAKLYEVYIFKISIKMWFFRCNYWYQKFDFLEFRLLFSRVASFKHELFEGRVDASSKSFFFLIKEACFP